MTYYDCGANAQIATCVVTGTHSSGKTTLVESFKDSAFAELCELYEPYGGSLAAGVLENNLLLPVFTIDEAATRRCNILDDSTIVTTNYSYAEQLQIDREASGGIFDVREFVTKAFFKLRREHSEASHIANAAVILSDRGPLDGKAYSMLRTPNEDDGPDKWMKNSRAFRGFLRAVAREFIDMVYICDHTEVPLEESQYRQPDLTFRNNIAKNIRTLYKEASDNRVITLQGSPEERRQKLINDISWRLMHDNVAVCAPTPRNEFFNPPFPSTQ